MSREVKGRSLIISFHKSFRGITFNHFSNGMIKLNLGWLRIELRDHIENYDKRVMDMVNHDHEKMRKEYYKMKE